MSLRVLIADNHFLTKGIFGLIGGNTQLTDREH